MGKQTMWGAQGNGTMHKRSDGRWEARYTTGIDPANGKQIQRSIYGKTQKEVRQQMTEMLTEVNGGTYFAPCDMMTSTWLDIWTGEYLGDVKPRTVDSCTNTVIHHLKPALGRSKLSAITTAQIQMLYSGLSKGRGEQATATAFTFHRLRRIPATEWRAPRETFSFGYRFCRNRRLLAGLAPFFDRYLG